MRTYYATKGAKNCGVVVESVCGLWRVLVRQPASDNVAAINVCYTEDALRTRLIRYNRMSTKERE